jgi:hypothetical protein
MKIKSYALIFAALTLILFSCERNKKKSETDKVDAVENMPDGDVDAHQWTEKNKLEFERNCVGFLEKEGVTDAKEYCDCLLASSIEAYPDPEVAFELEQNDIVALFEQSECIDDLLLVKIEDPWTEEVEQIFLEHCKKAQKEKGVEDADATSYCDCSLEQIKQILPNPHHVMSLTEEELTSILEKCNPSE